MIKNKYICILYCLSSGQNGENLGSDEQELVSICYIIIDVISKQVNYNEYHYMVILFFSIMYIYN